MLVDNSKIVNYTNFSYLINSRHIRHNVFQNKSNSVQRLNYVQNLNPTKSLNFTTILDKFRMKTTYKSNLKLCSIQDSKFEMTNSKFSHNDSLRSHSNELQNTYLKFISPNGPTSPDEFYNQSNMITSFSRYKSNLKLPRHVENTEIFNRTNNSFTNEQSSPIRSNKSIIHNNLDMIGTKSITSYQYNNLIGLNNPTPENYINSTNIDNSNLNYVTTTIGLYYSNIYVQNKSFRTISSTTNEINTSDDLCTHTNGQLPLNRINLYSTHDTNIVHDGINQNLLNTVNKTVIHKIPHPTVSKIESFLGAHVARDSNTHIHFDSDSIEIILDSGCSFTISNCKLDFINLRKSDGSVEGLGIHKIKGRGTVKYTVLDDNEDKINIIIENTLYVPSLQTRLLSIQQLAKQSEDNLAGAHILSDALHLRWDYHTKTIPYHSANNLPILFTVS